MSLLVFACGAVMTTTVANAFILETFTSVRSKLVLTVCAVTFDETLTTSS